ncbi:alpha/beta fold hydrolase [Pseudohalocynthiibacter aestuariivivens]|uniref:Alpha/beta fold hydrolase n=1 Tax=Pseudohalocynthiibacter aestuariivivens TaxID=1591409 RepID=A0ABV5JBZ2_9RHOB|nr:MULTISPECIES: alpha/beta hydrolase [Pseudohalocynthiibacter]MCK0103377.1 alpha/beta hydrolase [Pseudohalocynthiibacter sp. F2068]
MTFFKTNGAIGAALLTLNMMAGLTLSPNQALANSEAIDASAQSEAAVHYKNVEIDGLDIFYREAGPKDAPTLLLLHGFPTSSQQYRNLIPELSDEFHVIAPDYPGFGRSSMPPRDEFDYSFASYASLMESFTKELGLEDYAMYVMDYGAPVGYRLALSEPEKVTALIIQNGNAYEEGLLEFWDVFKTYWADNTQENREPLRGFLEIGATEWQYTHGIPEANISLVSPDAWTLDQAYLDRPGNQEIQLDLFYDYRTNVDLYPDFQEFFRTFQPPTLIVWGKNDVIFPAEGATPYLRDLPNAELHLLNAGHFALETNGPEIAEKIREFLERSLIN